LFETSQNNYLDDYVIGRWGMLEHAFTERDFAESLTLDEKLEHFQHRTKRTNIAKFSDILCAYQDDRCFYCEQEIYDKNQVDHVIPRKIIQHDHVWNLVLAHETCNQEKSDKIPSKRFIEKLIKRNEDVMESEHPLKEKMKLEVGADAPLRRAQVEQALKLTEKWNLGIFDGSGTISLQDEFLYNKIVRWRESNETK
jgi:5-methylcytosine-specific restriction endonuclease McrA